MAQVANQPLQEELAGTQSAEVEPWCLISAVNGQDASIKGFR